MPITRGEYVPLPAVVPRRVADTRTLGALLQRQGENQLQYQLGTGQSTAQMWMQLGRLFSSYADGRRDDQLKSTALAQRKSEQERDDQLKRDEFEERKAERAAATQLKNDAEKRRLTDEAAKIGDAVAEDVGYGPISEPQLNQVLASPVQAGRARYSFGPGTTDGPELLPTRDQQADIDWRTQVEAKGGMVGPKGQAVMPPPPKQEPNPTEASLAVMAANGDRGAIRALEVLRAQHPQRPPSNGQSNNRVVTIGNAFKTEPVVKKAQTMAEAVSFVNGLNLNTQNPADDQALIYSFAKAMDPDSVVREGEYATVQKYSQSLKDKFGFDIKRLYSNTTFLTPEARKNLKATIESRFAPVRSQYKALHDSYANRINKVTGQTDGADWLTDYGVSFPDAPNTAKKNPNR